MPLSPEHEALSFLLLAPAWEGLYKKRISEQVKACYDRLIVPSRDRKDQYPDDYIRGYVAALRWAIGWPEAEMNRAVAEAIQDKETKLEEFVPLFGGINEHGSSRSDSEDRIG